MSSELIDNKNERDDRAITASVFETLVETVKGIRFGSVELVIHEGRVVQIERRQKLRLEPRGGSETAG